MHWCILIGKEKQKNSKLSWPLAFLESSLRRTGRLLHDPFILYYFPLVSNQRCSSLSLDSGSLRRKRCAELVGPFHFHASVVFHSLRVCSSGALYLQDKDQCVLWERLRQYSTMSKATGL